MIKVRTMVGMAMGAGGMYFFDPRFGRGRRAKAIDQLRARAARSKRRAQQQAAYEEKRDWGERMKRAGAGRFHRRDDRSVADHLHQVLETLDVPTTEVTLEVLEDRVRLRGEVESDQHRSRILDTVGSECGDRQVESFLHLPGEPAPNKASALLADGPTGAGISQRGRPARSRPFARR